MSQGPEQQSITEAAAEWAVRLHAGALSEEAQTQLSSGWWPIPATPRPCALPSRPGPRWGIWHLSRGLWAHRQRPAEARPAPVTRRRRPLRWVGRAAVLSLVAVGWFSGPTLLIQMQADYRTGAGEIRTVQLDDGSSVQLDASSAISIDYDSGERRISLLAGSAVFDVAPMGEAETRPFVVQSAGGRTRALGTQFVVGRESRDQAWVGVLQHSVEVSLQAPPAQGAAQQTPGRGAERPLQRGAGCRKTARF